MSLDKELRERINDRVELALRPELHAAALIAVLDKHRTMQWFEECVDHKLDEENPDAYENTHWYAGDDGIVVCAETRLDDRCAECTPEYPDGDNDVVYPCSTVVAVAEALGVRVDAASGMEDRHGA